MWGFFYSIFVNYIFIINNSANEKLLIIHQNAGGTAGAGNAPYRGEFVAKWANTSNQINIIGFGSGGSNTLSSTSIMKVTHNFDSFTDYYLFTKDY